MGAQPSESDTSELTRKVQLQFHGQGGQRQFQGDVWQEESHRRGLSIANKESLVIAAIGYHLVRMRPGRRACDPCPVPL